MTYTAASSGDHKFRLGETGEIYDVVVEVTEDDVPYLDVDPGAAEVMSAGDWVHCAVGFPTREQAERFAQEANEDRCHNGKHSVMPRSEQHV